MANIMIVDDNQSIVETLDTLMKKTGYSTFIARSGEEFLSNVENAQPDLVLLDVMMPGLTTRQILGKLKEMNLSTLKIILVTVVRFSKEQLGELTDQFNIVEYIPKPFDVMDIIDKVKKHVGV